jgi:uncharacterized protein (TIGR02246 family)
LEEYLMSMPPRRLHAAPASRAGEDAVGELHRQLLNAWNRRAAEDFGALFAEDAYVVGFDGSQMDGRQQIATDIGAVFADHITATYVGKIEDVRLLTPQVAVLRAIVGMVPPGQSELNPDANALQTIVAIKSEDQWQIAVFQNTPAQFHGRPELVRKMTDELRQLL